MRFHFSTDAVAERDRFAFWADSLGSSVGLQRLPLPDAPRAFHATVTGRSFGPLGNLRMDADPHRTVRTSRDIAHRHLGGYWIYREASAGAWFSHCGRDFLTGPGSLVIADADLPFESQATGRLSYESWLMPKALLDPHLPARGRPLSMVLSTGSGLTALAATYLDAMTRNWDSFPEVAMMPVADTLARLVGIACGAAAAEQPDAVRSGRLVEAKGHIDRQLATANLSPATVAASLGIAVRTLHGLFVPTGISFSAYVQRRRLERCRSALLDNPTQPVTDIAFAWGFNSLSTFYRAFQTNFGMTPGELRDASGKARFA